MRNGLLIRLDWGTARWVLSAIGAVSLVTVAAMAQSAIQMGSRQGSFSFDFDNGQTRFISPGTPARLSGRRRFAESLDIRGDLSIMDGRFIQLQYGTTFSWTHDNSSFWTQQFGTEPVLLYGEGSRPGRGRLVGYVLGGSLLPGRRYNLTAFSNRNRNFSLREFAGSSEIVNSNRGVTLGLRHPLFPSSLTHRQENMQEQTSYGDVLGQREERRTIDSFEGAKQWNSNDLSARFEHSKITDQVQPLLSYTSDNATVSHRIFFRMDMPKLLQSRFQYNRRQGQLGLSSLFLTEEYQVQHSSTLNSFYNYTLSQFTTSRTDSTTHSLTAGLQHELFESVTTDAGTQMVSVAQSTATQQQAYRTRLNLRYRKQLPHSGLLTGNLGGTYELLDDRFQGTEIPVFQESHVARIGIPFLLNQPGVIQESLQVSGDSGRTLYREGVDYVVRTQGGFSEVSILFTGSIRDGEVLLIDYLVTTGADRRNATWSQAYGIGTDFGWINWHYSYNRNSRSQLSGVREAIPDDLRSHSAGLVLRWERRIMRVSLSNDYHTQDSALIPMDYLQLAQNLSLDIGRTLTLGLTLDEILTRYRDPKRRTDSGSGRLNLSWTPFPDLSADGFVAIRVWRDSVAEEEIFQSLAMRIVWSAGLVQVQGGYSLNIRRRDGDRSRENSVSLRIVRRF